MIPSIGKQGKNSGANRANELLSTLVGKLDTALAAPEMTMINQDDPYDAT
jgi:hypothetical protein